MVLTWSCLSEPCPQSGVLAWDHCPLTATSLPRLRPQSWRPCSGTFPVSLWAWSFSPFIWVQEKNHGLLGGFLPDSASPGSSVCVLVNSLPVLLGSCDGTCSVSASPRGRAEPRFSPNPAPSAQCARGASKQEARALVSLSYSLPQMLPGGRLSLCGSLLLRSLEALILKGCVSVRPSRGPGVLAALARVVASSPSPEVPALSASCSLAMPLPRRLCPLTRWSLPSIAL